MKFREHTEVGFLMLQWLGALVPGAFRQEVLRGRRTGMSADLLLLADECEPPPTPVQRLVALYPTRNEIKQATFKRIPGAMLTVSPEWAEAMGLDPDELEDA